MQSTIHKIISVLLCMSLLCSMLALVGAAEGNETEEEDYPYFYLDNRELQCSVLVVSFDPMYQKLGGEPVIAVTYTEQQDEDAQTSDADTEDQVVVLSIETENVRRELLIGKENEVHPQLFIRLPGYFSKIPESAKLTIGEDVFQSADGTSSPAVELELSRFVHRQDVDVSLHSRNVTMNRNVLVNTQISASFRSSAVPFYWESNAVWYLDDEPVGDHYHIDVRDTGNHTVSVRLNDFIYSHRNFYAVSRWEARRQQFDYFGSEILHGLANELISLPLLIVVPITALGFFGGAFLSVMDGIAGCFMSAFALYLYSAWDNSGIGFNLLGQSGKWKL